MKKALVITYYWPPAGGPGVQRMLKFVKFMPLFDVQPFVLTIDEHSAFYPVTDQSLLKDIDPELAVTKTKGLEPLKMLSKVIGKKEVPSSGFANHDKKTVASKAMRFLRGNLFIPDARNSWVKPAYKAACRIIEKENIQNVIISSPPHSSQLIGLRLKKKYPNLNFIADLRDPWTDIYYYNDLLHTSWAKKADAAYEKEVLVTADHVTVVSNGIKEMFGEKVPGLRDKILVIPNGFDEEDFKIPSNPPRDEFLLMHTGTLADTYNPEVFFRVFRKLIDKYGERALLKAQFVGKFSPQVRAFVDRYDLAANVLFKEYVPHSEAVKHMRDCSALLLIIAEASNEKGLISGKIFEYLAARKPIVAIGPRHGDAEDIISGCEAGKIFSRTQEDELLGYLQELIERWLKNSNLDLQDNKIDLYSRKSLTRQLCHIIQ